MNCLGDALNRRRLRGIDGAPKLESKGLNVAFEIGGFGVIPRDRITAAEATVTTTRARPNRRAKSLNV
jgi:hypothetical protein